MDVVLAERRSLKEALETLREKHAQAPNPTLARTIRLLENELKLREDKERQG